MIDLAGKQMLALLGGFALGDLDHPGADRLDRSVLAFDGKEAGQPVPRPRPGSAGSRR